MVEAPCNCRVDEGSFVRAGNTYQCQECGKLRWCPVPETRELKLIPSLQEGKIVESDGQDTTFFDELGYKPKRTRLNYLESLVDNWPLRYEDRVSEVQGMLSDYGLCIRSLYYATGEVQELVKDEPYLLCRMDWQEDLLTIDPCADQTPSATRGPDPNWPTDELSLNMIKGALPGGFRKEQAEAIACIMENTGSLTIAALPTGFGKTRISQVVTWLLRRREPRKGPTLVISPLISLMDDQRDQYDQAFNDAIGRIPGEEPIVTRFLTAAEERSPLEIMRELRDDKIDVLCCSPETLMAPVGSNHWVEVFLQMKNPFSFMVVDEAHVIGDWGASIRPQFQLLGWVKDRLLDRETELRVLLMSATITEAEEDELMKLFRSGLDPRPTIRLDRLREDLAFNVMVSEEESVEAFAEEELGRLHDERSKIPAVWFHDRDDPESAPNHPPLIIYTPERSVADGSMKQLAGQLFSDIPGRSTRGIVRTYTGETSADQRDRLRRMFLNDEFRVLVATSAFGMGIDKDDVWTIAYLGMPFTLKGLYQGFGRAARKSNWGEQEIQWRSGNCLGVIPYSVIGPRRFKPQLGKKKTIERVYDLLTLPGFNSTENGYLLLPVRRDLDAVAWSPASGTSIPEEPEPDDGGDEDDRDEYNLLEELKRIEKDRWLRHRSDMLRKDTLFQQRMWTIACLQRTERVEFLGLHQPILKRHRTTGENRRLIDVLSEGGYSGVIDVLKEDAPEWKTPRGQVRLAVLRFRTPITGWNAFKQLVREGHGMLHERHSRGRDELSRFIKQVKDGVCLRKAFAPAIGLKKLEARTCAQLNDQSRPAMPCSNCRQAMGFDSLEESGFLWSTDDVLARLRGDTLPEEPVLLENATRRQLREGKVQPVAGLEMVGQEPAIPTSLSWGVAPIGIYSLLDSSGRPEWELHVEDHHGRIRIDGVQRWPLSTKAIWLVTRPNPVARFVGEGSESMRLEGW